MTKNTQEKPHNARCTNCDTPFYRRPGGKAHCGKDACKKALQRASDKTSKAPKQTTAEKHLAKLLGSAGWNQLLDFCRRGGTVETCRGMTAEDLQDFFVLHEHRRTRYGYDPICKIQHYPICHVQPLCSDTHIGLSYSKNIFIGLHKPNSSIGNKSVSDWAGSSIPKSSLQRKFKVVKDEGNSKVSAKLIKLLGKELDIFLANLNSPLKPPKKIELATRIYNRQGTSREKVKLSQYYPLASLKKKDFDTLLEMEAIQLGRLEEYLLSKRFRVQRFGTCTTDSELGVLYDSLQRFVNILPDGEHRDNCIAMLPLVHTFGIYLAQLQHQEVVHGRWMVPNTDWQPLKFVVTRLGELEDRDLNRRVADVEADSILHKHIKAVVYDTLQGLNTGFRIRNARQRIIDHLDLVNLVPMPVVDAYSKPLEDFAYILDVCMPHWEALATTQFVTTDGVATAPVQLAQNMQLAIEKAQQQWLRTNHPPRHYRGKYYRHWGWKGDYPERLTVPDIDALLAAA